MPVMYISPEKFDLLFETLKTLNPYVPKERIARILQMVSVANRVAYESGFREDLEVSDIEPWKPITEESDCWPGIPSFCDGSLLRWVKRFIRDCMDEAGTDFLPEPIQDSLYGLLPAYELRNERSPGARTTDEWVKRGQDDCLRAIREGQGSLAALRAIWLFRIAHLQNVDILGVPERSPRRTIPTGEDAYHHHAGMMVASLREVH